MHKIGALPILSYAQDHDELLAKPEELFQLIRDNHPKIGEFILKSWKFPEEIVLVPTDLQRRRLETQQSPDLTGIILASILKTNEISKFDLIVQTDSTSAKQILNLESDEPLNDQLFQDSLAESLKFYSQLN
jgi:HD-like signal output (HDOD) protein